MHTNGRRGEERKRGNHIPSRSILHVPPPSRQRCFSASSTQLKDCVMRSAPFRSAGAEVGGVQVAMVKRSTNLRMKKRGKVPPRLLTLESPEH